MATMIGGGGGGEIRWWWWWWVTPTEAKWTTVLLANVSVCLVQVATAKSKKSGEEDGQYIHYLFDDGDTDCVQAVHHHQEQTSIHWADSVTQPHFLPLSFFFSVSVSVSVSVCTRRTVLFTVAAAVVSVAAADVDCCQRWRRLSAKLVLLSR